MFTAEFLKKVPPVQLRMGLVGLMQKAGTCRSIRMVSTTSEYSGKAEAVSDSGYIYPITITIEPQPPHKISGLFISTPVKQLATLDSVVASLGALEGTTSLCVTDLTSGRILAAKDTARYLPIGSTFKLYILGEMARSIDVGTHQWNEVVTLDSNQYSLPSGVMHTWPHGAPVTLHTLASQMISISDNTATDILLNHLGRGRVETTQKLMGHSKHELNVPFLSTRELFLMKYTGGGSPARMYASLDARQKTRYLKSTVSSISLDSVAFVDTPVLPDSVEWFARTTDLCRAMDWLRKASVQPYGHPVLGILGINDGVDVDTKIWKTIGYKGGSEPGVLNMTYLLEHTNGRWYALSCSWMRTDQDVDLATFAGIVEQAIRVLGASAP
jgi:beta-lactamase class A